MKCDVCDNHMTELYDDSGTFPNGNYLCAVCLDVQFADGTRDKLTEETIEILNKDE